MMPPPSLLKLSIQDFFTPPVLKLAFLPFIITILVMYSLFFMAADYGLDQLADSQVQIEQTQTQLHDDGTTRIDTLKETFSGSSIMTFLLKYSVTSWLVSFLVYTVGSFVVMYLSVAVGLFVIGFLTPWVIPIIRDRHYSDVQIHGFGTIPQVLWHFVSTSAVMIGLFFLLIPFYFIPLLNILAFNLPFYYFFHRLLNFDVGSTICTKDQYKQIMFYRGNSIRFKTFVMYLVTLLPFAAIFVMLFFVVYLSHVYLSERRKMETTEMTPAVA